MTATTELINYVLRINPEHNTLGPGFLANLISLAERAQEEQETWIKHDPADPIPEQYSRVKCVDGGESSYQHWSDRAWNHTSQHPTHHIEFYKP